MQEIYALICFDSKEKKGNQFIILLFSTNGSEHTGRLGPMEFERCAKQQLLHTMDNPMEILPPSKIAKYKFDNLYLFIILIFLIIFFIVLCLYTVLTLP